MEKPPLYDGPFEIYMEVDAEGRTTEAVLGQAVNMNFAKMMIHALNAAAILVGQTRVEYFFRRPGSLSAE